VLLIFTYFIYQPHLLSFLNDDMIHLPLSSKGIFFQRNSFRPIHDLMLALEYRLWGINPIGYHLIEFLIHILCCCLIYKFSFRLITDYGSVNAQNIESTSLIIASIFSIYSFHSESVLWILGSGASLCTLFFMFSCIYYFKRWKSLSNLLLSLLFLQIGLFTYEAIWVAPLFIVLLSTIDIYNKRTELKNEFIYPLFYVLSFGANLIIRQLILGEIAGSYGSEKIFSFNIKKLIYNGLLLFLRSFIPPNVSSIYFILGIAIFLIFLFLFIKKIKDTQILDDLMMLLFISFICSLFPAINLGISSHSRESERFLYLPSVFLCILIIYSLIKFDLSRPIFKLIILLLFIYNGYYTYINARDYTIAGNISTKVYNHFKKDVDTHDSIILTNLPQEFNGVPLFRIGLKEGLYWLYKIDTSKISFIKTVACIGLNNYYLHPFRKNYNLHIESNRENNKEYLKLIYDSTNFRIKDFIK